MNFIQNWIWSFSWEWFASHCKWDNKQYSWGHWTRCYNPWQAVTVEQADKEFTTHLNPLFELVDNSCYTDNQKIAIVSYMYNTWWYQMNMRTHVSNCSKKDIQYIMQVWWYWITVIENWKKKFKRLQWLVNRRYAELSLFNS